MTIRLICWNCNEEVELEFLRDITECPNCGTQIQYETCKIAD